MSYQRGPWAQLDNRHVQFTCESRASWPAYSYPFTSRFDANKIPGPIVNRGWDWTVRNFWVTHALFSLLLSHSLVSATPLRACCGTEKCGSVCGSSSRWLRCRSGPVPAAISPPPSFQIHSQGTMSTRTYSYTYTRNEESTGPPYVFKTRRGAPMKEVRQRDDEGVRQTYQKEKEDLIWQQSFWSRQCCPSLL